MMAGLLLTIAYSRKQALILTWWQWLITVLGFIYATFILEMIAAFIKEGAPKAALITGITFGFLAIVWGVLLARFIFSKQKRLKTR